MNKNAILLGVLFLLIQVAAMQAQIGGSRNYALGTGSVMRYGYPSALFVNPAELGRIHQKELYMSTNRFATLPSISVAQFFPYLGTFAAGIGNESGYTQYSLGYGGIIYDRHSIGGSLNILENTGSDVTVSLGSTVHFPDSEGRNSGILVGASLVNFSSNTSLPGQRFSAGGGYWVLPNRLVLQGSWLYEDKESKFPIGAEYLFNSGLAVQMGLKGEGGLSAGISYAVQAMNLDLAVGKQGISFSVNVRFSDQAQTIRDSYYERGIKDYDRGEYPEAKEAFRAALEYDEYFEAARTYVNLSSDVTVTKTRILVRDAQKYEEEGKLLDAKKNYTKILQSYPDDALAKNRLLVMQPALHREAIRLTAIADSLKQGLKFEDARENYLLAFEYDPNDETILKSLSAMEKLIADSVSFYLTKGNSHLEKNQLEGAQAAFKTVLRYDNGNPEARLNLSATENKLRANVTAAKTTKVTKESFDKGKTAFDNGDYFEAIAQFNDYLKQDPKNKEAQSYIDKSRESLLPKMEEYFKIGLQFYVDENYKSALEIWNKALIVKPDHQAILEYKKRADLKLEALERLK